MLVLQRVQIVKRCSEALRRQACLCTAWAYLPRHTFKICCIQCGLCCTIRQTTTHMIVEAVWETYVLHAGGGHCNHAPGTSVTTLNREAVVMVVLLLFPSGLGCRRCSTCTVNRVCLQLHTCCRQLLYAGVGLQFSQLYVQY